MRTWGGQVDEVVFSVDTRPSPGRGGPEWDQGVPKVAAVLDDLRMKHRHVRVVDVDYSEPASGFVSKEFFGGAPIPAKDFVGAPFYAYLHGLHSASNSLVLHLDADMLFGGGSQSWLEEAIAALNSRPDVLVCAPLAGPPTEDGAIPQSVADFHHRIQRYGSAPVLQQCETRSYAYAHMTSRVFLIDRERFARDVGSLKAMRFLRRAYPRRRGQAAFYPLETVFSRAMHRHGLIRLNMLGREPGMWFVHPPPRQPGIERELPRLIERVEQGEVPDGQRGDDQMNDSMFGEPTRDTFSPAPSLWRRIRKRVFSRPKLTG